MESQGFIAHRRDSDQEDQTLAAHLSGVALLAKTYASKLGIESAGELIGLLHDLGKYSEKFQHYLKSGLGDFDPDADEYIDAKANKGKIDHSTAGAQLIWNALQNAKDKRQHGTAQILALCIASHHSGLINCLESTLQNPTRDRFSSRMQKSEQDAHLQEVMAKMDSAIRQRSQQLLSDPQLINQLTRKLGEIFQLDQNRKIPAVFKQGLLIRYLFSCLIDADRTDTADFEKPVAARKRQNGRYQHFQTLADRLETKLATFRADTEVNQIRKTISDTCLQRAEDKQGIFTLSVPTGGGKTLASLRFALKHAEKHKLERVVYIIPFTSIIDQNADETRKILEPEGSTDGGNIVLEHHANLTSDKQTWKNKILAENWDAPVVYTTMVQFLETLFGSGTRGARRMHQLAKSVLIFDEIQTLPVNCVHLFNNALQFLVDHCGSTAILCTATQPLLHRVDPNQGSLRLNPDSELMQSQEVSVTQLFEELRRVDIIDCQRPEAYSFAEIADLALAEQATTGSCLVIVNTKKAAQAIFQSLQEHGPAHAALFHLSTSMCPAHRKKVLRVMRKLLARQRAVLCVSTQLIEAGVDISFGSVIRINAGLDSIAQAAGRCNRHGELRHTNGTAQKGRVSIVNLDTSDEKLGMLPDIAIGQQETARVLRDFKQSPETFDQGNLLGPVAIERFFRYYFFERQAEMCYPITGDAVNDSLLNLLSQNTKLINNYQRTNQGKSPPILFRQSFMTAAKAFKAINAPTRGVIVPYGRRGTEIINALCSVPEPDKQYTLLREAQQYTVNVFPHLLDELIAAEALSTVQKDVDILYVKGEYYSTNFGLSNEIVGETDFPGML